MKQAQNAQHTSGPWEVHQEPGRPETLGHYVTTADGLTIAAVYYQLPTYASGEVVEMERLANARLIAAAPDLLHAAAQGHSDSPGLPCGDLLAAANALRNSGQVELAERLEAKHEIERVAIARIREAA